MALKLITSQASIVSVYINEKQNNNEVVGTLYNESLNRAENFYSAFDFVEKLQEVYNDLSFPHSSFELRSFNKAKKTLKDKTSVNKEDLDMQEEMSNKPKNQDAQFIIHVKYRQNASWQGTIKWVQKNQELPFRSTLELLNLMNGAIEESIEKQEKQALKWG